MADNDQPSPQDDEVILSALYSPSKVLITWIVHLPLLLLFFGISYGALLEGGYLAGVFVALCSFGYLLLALHPIFVDELLFYQDRVVQMRRFFGPRTVYYSNGYVIGPPDKLLSSQYRIYELKEGGNALKKQPSAFYTSWFVPVKRQLPISYIAFFFPSDTAKKVRAILDYLTDDKEKLGMFKKSTLPKEVISQM
jgi:hypothetical protein